MGVELVRRCAGGAEALSVVRSERMSGCPIHLLFLDVQMHEMDGLGVVSGCLHGRRSCA
jgi:CheY-like chemotaxis protein